METAKNVLVVGGAGYIGSHICKALSRQGYTPHSLDNFEHGHRELVKWGPVIEADLRDDGGLPKALAGFRPLAVIHLAARIEVGASVESPLDFFENNVSGTLNLLRALPERTPVIFSSTAAVYGEPGLDLIPETTLLKPVNPYGTSKRMIEDVLRDLWQHRRWPSVILRYFNVAGADPEAETGEWHEPETHLIPLLLQAARTGGEVKVFGNDYPTPDGTCLRDYVHVSDLADAHVRALEWILKEPRHEAFNIGYSQGRSVFEMIRAVEEACAVKLSQRILPRRAGDPARLIADSRRALEVLGWKPAYADRLKETIQHAWAWENKLAQFRLGDRL